MASTQYVSTAYDATWEYIPNGGKQYVLGYGQVGNITIMAGGTQIIQNNGSAFDTTVSSGGSQLVLQGGRTHWSILKQGASQIINGGEAQTTVISAGARQIMSNGGLAQAAMVEVGGVQLVNKWGITSNTSISSGGQQIISGGSSLSDFINNGGKQILYTGVARYTQNSGGLQIVSGGTASQSYIQGGDQILVKWGRASNTRIHGGNQYVSSGGIDTGAEVGDGNGRSTQTIFAGGKANGARFYIGGSQIISSGGLAQWTTTLGGQIHVKKGGTVKGAFIDGGYANVSSGGIASNTTVRGGELFIAGGAMVNKIKVIEGARLTLDSGTVVSNLTVSGGGTLVASNAVLKGYNVFHHTGSSRKSGNLTIQSGASLVFEDASHTLRNVNVYAKGAKITINKTASYYDNTIEMRSLTTNSKTSIKMDISGSGANDYMAMVSLGKFKTYQGTFSINVDKLQDLGEYQIANNLGFAATPYFNITQGKTTLGRVKLNGQYGMAKNGTLYKVESSRYGRTTLTLSVFAGSMLKGTSGNNTMKGASHSDIFYGGAGNDVINGVHGRDVAVYDTKNWGKDSISATSGSMTLLFVGMNDQQYTTAMKGKDLVITRKADKKQTVTIKNYNESQHTIIATTETTAAMKSWLNSAKPSDSVKKQAQADIFNLAGLA